MSGGPYIEHPLQTALFLAELHLDATTISSALLHDVIEDCNVTYDDIKIRFGEDVAKLVDSVTKLTRMDLALMDKEDPQQASAFQEDRLRAESLRKMLVAMAEDVRVVLIKLADRLHNMRTLGALAPHRRNAIAQETLDIYCPLAHRLGIWDIKWRLEDMAFRHLEEDKYREISKMLSIKREERESYISRVAEILKKEMDSLSLDAQVVGRPKHIYSIYQKIQKYAIQGKELGEIYDLYALRVLVKTKGDCYNALGVVHDLWHPMPGQFDDYIANPKDTMYQSLHTTVMCDGGAPLEVQIRTYEMHQTAEYGVAAHWRYKEGSAGDVRFEDKMTWFRQLLEWHREVTGTEEFLESVKTDLFRDQVFVYTPKGDIIELPSGATPIDFAYKIHTELGHRCIGGKVNGRLVSLDMPLKNGDTVEILTTKVARGPSLDWLNSNLGYVRSASAREKIRQWFRKQERQANIQRGHDLLRKELKRLNASYDESEVARMFRYDTPEDFLAALGSGGITENQVVSRLTAQQEKPQEEHKPTLPLSRPTSGVEVMGVGDLLIQMGRCCNPLPGEEIIGYITRSRGVTVHKANCPNVLNEDEQERLVNVEWGQTKQLYPIRLTVQAWDRVGLLRDITTQVSEEGVNIASAVTTENTDGTSTTSLTLHTTGVDQLGRLFS
ncbi:MAG: bifunctional (p)ppGpp synthetase/guanosine-3',5'-bis(diphosphate) 3'-pyrophosphohydrolase [Dehalococcoidia bacterium]|nr:bifunctional (p)ppGpp synthetase/guanosine-3',5'-bis(diphosphate) 3'-pyrophosphohydrolase [Dehalococcoidia bacterium]